jgi:hypothetical protein
VRPHLRFFTELDGSELPSLFTPDVVAALHRLEAGVTMGLTDLSATRAQVIRQLNGEGIPVGAWVLLPREAGYFAHADNAALVGARCEEILRFADAGQLTFEALGLDFEPALHELEALLRRPLSTLWMWKRRAADHARLARARGQYRALIARLRGRGLRVESYQFPTLLDDRAGQRTFWQRFAGAMDVEVDREVLMLYSSLFSPALLESFGPEARAIGIGSTGGGVDPLPKLGWSRFERDLRLASGWCDDVSIFSLEGCVEQGFLPRLLDFDWAAPAPRSPPRHVLSLARRLLGALTSVL